MRTIRSSAIPVLPSQNLYTFPPLKSGAQDIRRWQLARCKINEHGSLQRRWITSADRYVFPQHAGNIYTILKERGLINQVAGDETRVEQALNDKSVAVYLGVDPTAESMHIGHLVPIMMMAWLFKAGHHCYTVIGGATAMIGDPSHRSVARNKQERKQQEKNQVKIHQQLTSIWRNIKEQGVTEENGFHNLLDNMSWLKKLSSLDFLSKLAPNMRMGPLLSRDFVKTRLGNGTGMSLAEFLYPTIQGWDWWHLYVTRNVQIQIGGSDQFGNMLAGIETIESMQSSRSDTKSKGKSLPEKLPIGITVPLLTNASGTKMSKSSDNVVWLHAKRTSPFDLYQYFVSTPDSQVERYLKLLTFRPLENIAELMQEQQKDPSRRIAQHALAEEVVRLAHSVNCAFQAERRHALFFSTRNKKGSWITISDDTDGDSSEPQSFEGPDEKTSAGETDALLPAPVATISLDDLKTQPLYKILSIAGIAGSNTEGRRLCESGAIYLAQPNRSGQLAFSKFEQGITKLSEGFLFKDNALVLRIGKTRVRVVNVAAAEAR